MHSSWTWLPVYSFFQVILIMGLTAPPLYLMRNAWVHHSIILFAKIQQASIQKFSTRVGTIVD